MRNAEATDPHDRPALARRLGDQRGNAPAHELAAQRVPRLVLLVGSGGRRSDRPRERTRLADADLDRAPVHRADARVRRADPERLRRLAGRGGRRGRHDRQPLDGDRRRDRPHGRRHARDVATRDRRRQLLRPERDPPAGAEARRGRDGRSGAVSPRDRRPRACRPDARDPGRQRTHDGPLGQRRQPSPDPLGVRLVVANRCRADRDPARDERGHPGVPLVGQGAGPRGVVVAAARCRSDRAADLERQGTPVCRRRQPRQHVLRRCSAQLADDEHGASARPPRPDRQRLLRILREPVQPHAHDRARDRRHLERALAGSAAEAARHPAPRAPRAQVLVRPRLDDRRPARPAGRIGRRGHLRRAPRPLHDVHRLRRGRPPLGDRAPGDAEDPPQARPPVRAPGARRGGRPAAGAIRRALRSRPDAGNDLPRPVRHLAPRSGHRGNGSQRPELEPGRRGADVPRRVADRGVRRRGGNRHVDADRDQESDRQRGRAGRPGRQGGAQGAAGGRSSGRPRSS